MANETITNFYYYQPEQPFIKATEVLEEVEKRLRDGKQYTTFPNKISDEEKAKVEAKGYYVTRNYIHNENRDGAEPAELYIGFQVALTEEAANKSMIISEAETNGIELSASDISYDGTSSELSATNVQEAIDEVQSNVDDLPKPMVYHGTLGVGGEVTELPEPSEENRGWTYKVITAGTYQGIAAEVGDSFISFATRWDLVPSGDEPGGTVLSVEITSTDTSAVITGTNPITSTGTIDISVPVVSYDSTNAKLKKTVGGVTSDVMTVDTTPTTNSKNPVTSGAVNAGLALKADLSILTPISESAYEDLVTKDKPLYFIYET